MTIIIHQGEFERPDNSYIKIYHVIYDIFLCGNTWNVIFIV